MASKRAQQRLPLLNFGLWSGISNLKTIHPVHRHNEIELNLVEHGDIIYLWNDQEIFIKRGRTAVFWAAIPHQIIYRTENAVLHWLTCPLYWFLQWQLPDTLTDYLLSQTAMALSDATNADLDHLQFLRWHRDIQLSTNERTSIIMLELEAWLRRLALYNYQISHSGDSIHKPDNRPDTISHQKARQMAIFIAQHYTELIDVNRIASVVDLHPNYAMSIFSETFNVSILDYLTQHRVTHAQRLLLTTDKPINNIAEESGFGSISRFYAVFKDKCGLPPRQYRLNYRKF